MTGPREPRTDARRGAGKRLVGLLSAIATVMAVLPAAVFSSGLSTAAAVPPHNAVRAVAGAAPRPLRWLAAGDSYTAGQGLPDAQLPCERVPDHETADLAWPQVAVEAEVAGAPTWTQDFRACSGAKADEFFHPQALQTLPYVELGGPPQWTPASGRYDLISFSLGGNDVGFEPFILKCLGVAAFNDTWPSLLYKSPIGCPSSSGEETKIDEHVGSGYSEFLDAVASEAVTPGGNIVVVGYPKLLAAPADWALWERVADNCAGLTQDDATEIRTLSEKLNQALRTAVDAAAANAPDGVHISFADIDGGGSLGTGAASIAATDPRLYDPAGGLAHGVCSGHDWINGITTDHLSFGSFHPNAAGAAATGELLAHVVDTLDWSGLGVPQLPGQDVSNRVIVPGGWEQAVSDHAGNIVFWKHTNATGTLIEVGHSRYLVLQNEGQPSASVTGALLPGMADAIFIATGPYSGDGTGRFIAYGTGPRGWGTLVQEGNALVATGNAATDNLSAANSYTEEFADDGVRIWAPTGINTGSATPLSFGPNAEGLQVQRTYSWDGTELTQSGTSIVTATQLPDQQISGVPSQQLDRCPAALPDGTYQGIVSTDMNDEGDTIFPRPAWAYVSGWDGPGQLDTFPKCTYPLQPTTPIEVPVFPADGSLEYLSGPAWLLGRDASGTPILPALAGTSTAQGDTDLPGYPGTATGFEVYGTTPWYIPPPIGGTFVPIFTIDGGDVALLTVSGSQLTRIVLAPLLDD